MKSSELVTQKFYQELSLALEARKNLDGKAEWNHLERAHVLGQFQALRLLWVHILMLRFSIVHFMPTEFLGQNPANSFSSSRIYHSNGTKRKYGRSECRNFRENGLPAGLKGFALM